MAKKTVEQLEKSILEWLKNIVKPFYEGNINNPDIIGKEMKFPTDNNLILTPYDISWVEDLFTDWLEWDIFKCRFGDFNSGRDTSYTNVSLEAFNTSLCDKDYEALGDLGYEEDLLSHDSRCILKIIVPKPVVHEKEISVRFEVNFIHKGVLDDWEIISEEQYEEIKNFFKDLEDNRYECSNWEVPYIDDPSITEERVTEKSIYIDAEDDIIEEIEDSIKSWFLHDVIYDKCTKFSTNQKYLEEDEVLKLEILTDEDVVLKEDLINDVDDICEDQLYELEEWPYWDDEFGIKEFDEDARIYKELAHPEFDYKYDEKNQIVTIRIKFKVHYCGIWGGCRI